VIGVKNVEIAEILGNALGDGSFVKMKSGKLRFQLRGHLKEDRDHYDNFIIPAFNKRIAYPLTGKKVGILIYKKRNSYGIGTESKAVSKFLKSIGLPIGTKKEINVPEWIKSNKENEKAFLRGLMDTDGSVYFSNPKNNTAITFDIGFTSKVFVKEIYNILNLLGYNPYLIKPYKKKNPREKILYKVRIKRKADTEKWINEIGFNNPKHSTKIEVYKKYGFCPPRTTIENRKILVTLRS